ncbi:MAG TPA: NUDIX hydrolase [Chloroflexota bacterium]|nr:NUDIX hydrolase [Chloroflexota bacterium]
MAGGTNGGNGAAENEHESSASNREVESDLFPRAVENPWKTLSSRIVYENRRVRLREDQVTTPANTPGSYTYLEAAHPVAVIAALDDAERLYLVREWRYVWGRDSWELPGGLLEAGEDPIAGAKRELAEEAGVQAEEWQHLVQFHVSASISTPFHFFLARGLSPISATRDLEEADMIVRAVPLPAVVQAVMDGTIVHAASIGGILRVARLLGH